MPEVIEVPNEHLHESINGTAEEKISNENKKARQYIAG
jgi:hypothetical protein